MHLNDSQYYFILDTSMNLLSKKTVKNRKSKGNRGNYKLAGKRNRCTEKESRCA